MLPFSANYITVNGAGTVWAFGEGELHNEGLTLLLLVVTNGSKNLEITTMLVGGGADVNATNKKGKSVLNVAKGKGLLKSEWGS